ncbi:MAG: C69 family dipeptidase [Planctomycetaceae bacterium]|jgi:dipeptidase|nr:C69 family dipeptidase [Planctomycetaceae bacterium]
MKITQIQNLNSHESKQLTQQNILAENTILAKLFLQTINWIVIFFVICLINSTSYVLACTNILVSKGASADGSVAITYTADSAGFFPQLSIFPAKDHEPNTTITVPENEFHPEIKIKQAPHTHQIIGVIWEAGTSHGDHFPRQGCINEFQLAIAETTFGGHEDLVNPKAAINYPMLITFALQRAKTAREAINVMIDLVDEYGYCDVGESISIADKNEAWVFEIVGTGPRELSKGNNAVWVAKRVPDGEISAHANQARIGEIPNKKDPNNCFYSDNIKKFAIDQKLYDPNSNKPFRFDDAYGKIDAKSKRVCESRVWSIFNRAAPSQKFSPDYHRGKENTKPYAWSIKPDKKLTTADIMSLMRDNYENTEFDMTKGIDAGNYGTPRRWRPLYWKVKDDENEYAWERPISTQQTGFSIVTQSRSHLPDPIGGILWYGVDDSFLTCYFPLYCGISDLPKSFTIGSIREFSWDSTWWVTNLLSNYANLKYSVIAPDIIAVQKELETKFFTLQKPVEKTAAEIFKTNPELTKQYLTDYSISQAELVAARWKKLATDTFTKHNDGYVRTKEGNYPNEAAAYPEEWLKRVLKEKPTAFKLPVEKNVDIDREYFEKSARKIFDFGLDNIDEFNGQKKNENKNIHENEKSKNINKLILNLRLKQFEIFFAENKLIESFENKTYNTNKTKTEINNLIKQTNSINLPETAKLAIVWHNAGKYDDKELEICKRILQVFIETKNDQNKNE